MLKFLFPFLPSFSFYLFVFSCRKLVKVWFIPWWGDSRFKGPFVILGKSCLWKVLFNDMFFIFVRVLLFSKSLLLVYCYPDNFFLVVVFNFSLSYLICSYIYDFICKFLCINARFILSLLISSNLFNETKKGVGDWVIVKLNWFVKLHLFYFFLLNLSA